MILDLGLWASSFILHCRHFIIYLCKSAQWITLLEILCLIKKIKWILSQSVLFLDCCTRLGGSSMSTWKAYECRISLFDLCVCACAHALVYLHVCLCVWRYCLSFLLSCKKWQDKLNMSGWEYGWASNAFVNTCSHSHANMIMTAIIHLECEQMKTWWANEWYLLVVVCIRDTYDKIAKSHCWENIVLCLFKYCFVVDMSNTCSDRKIKSKKFLVFII